jgi:YegS/Rv2252/BmrU family lipid kinase
MSAADAPLTVAVVAHQKKSLGGGLAELRQLLADEGIDKPLWYEVSKSRQAPKKIRRALKEGAELVFVWGGDGMVQHCADALAGTKAIVAIVPAGTANLLAGNLGIPKDLPEAVRIGLRGADRRLDLGKVNGEHFAVMAGAGFDGEMIRSADRKLKARLGPLAYVWTSLRHVDNKPVPTAIRIDGHAWFAGQASCVLLANVGKLTGGITVFKDAQPDDGWLEVGVTTARGAVQWARTFGHLVIGRPERSPFVRTTRAQKVEATFGAPMTYELDGGERDSVTRIKGRVVPAALTVRVPDANSPSRP